VQAAVKHALAQFSITPTLEFDLDPTIQQLDAVTKPFTEENKQQQRVLPYSKISPKSTRRISSHLRKKAS